MSKIGIVSDLHLGHRKVNIENYTEVLNKLQNIHGVDMIVDCGDIFDTSTINAVNAKEIKDAFKNMNIPIHIIRGNHDTLSEVSVASMLDLSNNITIHNSVDIVYFNNQSFLFVPYVNSKTELDKNLGFVKEQVNFAFSHLNLTNNFYATFSTKIADKYFHKYAEYWFNGHIHTPEIYSSLFGKIYNVGSVSSLTYGDEHKPCYAIFDTVTLEYKDFYIDNSIIHKTFSLQNIDDLQSILDDLKQLYSNNLWNLRIKIPNSFLTEEKDKIKDIINSYLTDKILEIQFDYLSSNNNIEIKNLSVQQNKSKQPLIYQLFTEYELKGKILDKDIKEEIIEEI